MKASHPQTQKKVTDMFSTEETDSTMMQGHHNKKKTITRLWWLSNFSRHHQHHQSLVPTRVSYMNVVSPLRSILKHRIGWKRPSMITECCCLRIHVWVIQLLYMIKSYFTPVKTIKYMHMCKTCEKLVVGCEARMPNMWGRKLKSCEGDKVMFPKFHHFWGKVSTAIKIPHNLRCSYRENYIIEMLRWTCLLTKNNIMQL